jgi:hypothetical protein
MRAKQRVSDPAVPRRGLGILDFCATYDISRTKTYEEIKAGRLKIRKVGTRTIIAVEDAEDWFTGCAPHSSP